MNKLFMYVFVTCGTLLFLACYNNKKDISLPTASTISILSFRDDIVPIITAGGCGCHNNGKTSNAIQFMIKDTIYYGTILARSGVFNDMASGKDHPGEGGIFFSASQAALIKTWVLQGAKDNYVAPAITGPVTYTTNIVPIYKTVCKGSSCHGGIGPNLDYATLVSVKDDISKIAASAGAVGHKGGAMSLDGVTTSTFLAWIAQGLPL